MKTIVLNFKYALPCEMKNAKKKKKKIYNHHYKRTHKERKQIDRYYQSLTAVYSFPNCFSFDVNIIILFYYILVLILPLIIKGHIIIISD